MPEALGSTESAAKVYAALLRRLHGLIAEGLDEGPDGDALRDAMDRPWSAMNEAERRRVGALSGDLYDLAEGGPARASMSLDDRWAWGGAVRAAHVADDWDQILELLRRPPPHVPSDMIQFMRARAWEHFGDPETAHVFMQAAEQVNPDHVLPALTHHRPAE